MNIAVILIEMLIFSLLFTVMCFKTSGKNNTVQIHNYPPEIQEEYFKTHARVPTEPLSKRTVLTKGIAILIFAAVLVVMALLAGAKDFLQGFLFAFGMMAWIGAYDTFFIDWVLFANLKRFRLEGTEHMDEAYHQKWFHLKGMLFPGIVVAGHAKRKKLTRKIQKNLLWVIKKPLDTISRGFYQYVGYLAIQCVTNVIQQVYIQIIECVIA